MGSSDYLLENLAGCRDHFAGAVFNGAFALPGDKPRYPRDRIANIKHVRLDIALDLDAKRISGGVSHTFSPLNDGLDHIELDAVDLTIGAVRNAVGRDLAHSLSGGRLRIELGEEMTGGREETVNVEFSGSPRRGLYFIGPEDAYPNKRMEAWTQGQDEDSRHWFPCYDY